MKVLPIALQTVFPTKASFVEALEKQPNLVSWCIAFDLALISISSYGWDVSRSMLGSITNRGIIDIGGYIRRTTQMFNGLGLALFLQEFDTSGKYDECLEYLESGAETLEYSQIAVKVTLSELGVEVKDPASLISRVHAKTCGSKIFFPKVPHVYRHVYINGLADIQRAVADFAALNCPVPETPATQVFDTMDAAPYLRGKDAGYAKTFVEGMRAGYDLAISRGVR